MGSLYADYCNEEEKREKAGEATTYSCRERYSCGYLKDRDNSIKKLEEKVSALQKKIALTEKQKKIEELEEALRKLKRE